jgi:hypothetical protein
MIQSGRFPGSFRVRTTRSTGGFAAVFFAALVVLSGAGAHAAATVPMRAVGQDEAAEQAFHLGVEAARQERWVDARAAFEQAYSLSPRPVVLINLAGAQARTGRLTEAARNYHRILEDQTSPETASFRRAAAEVLPALEARIPRVRLRPSGLSAADVIRIDGDATSAETLTTGQVLDPGEHTLVVEHGGVERARVLFALIERELRYIALPLPVLAGPQPANAAVIDVPISDAMAEPTAKRSLWASPWTWTAIAVAVAGASVATFVLVENRDQTFSGSIPPGQISVR